MALPTPKDAAEIAFRTKTDVRATIENSRPFLRRSFLGALIDGISNRVFEFFDALRASELEANPATAVRNFPRWMRGLGLTPLPGSPAAGEVFLNAGSFSGVVPAGSRMVTSMGSAYIVQADASASSIPVSLASLTASGLVATATTATLHRLASNARVIVTGGEPSEFGVGVTDITVTGPDTFEYELASMPSTTTATTLPSAATIGVIVTVRAEDAGEDQNLVPGAELTLEQPISGIDLAGLVVHPGVIDGTGLETLEAQRTRLLDRIRNPVANFNKAQIRARSLAVPGVTRVFVKSAYPAPGRVTVLFMRDLDDATIPDAAEITILRNALLEIRPATMSTGDLVIPQLTAMPTDFTFTGLVPDTGSMRAAIRDQLADFFSLRAEPGLSVPEDAYRSAIFNTLDPVTGSRVTSFTLSTPTSALSASGNQVRTLGTVTFT